MGMISHVRRRSVIASTYGVELSPEDDRHSPEARKSATADYGATFKGRERGTGEQPTCCDRCFPIQTEDSKFRKTWDKIQIVALLYVAVLVPIRSGFDLEDLELVSRLGGGKVDLAIGSALDIFGGKLAYDSVVAWSHTHQGAC